MLAAELAISNIASRKWNIPPGNQLISVNVLVGVMSTFLAGG
jgi:hypothetical protein